MGSKVGSAPGAAIAALIALVCLVHSSAAHLHPNGTFSDKERYALR